MIVAGIFIWQFYALPLNSKAWIREIKETRSIETKTNDLSWLATFQPWSPPYDFSGTPQLANIWIPKLRMYAPNFSGVPFSRVWFQYAQLPSASFSQSRITMDADPQGFDGRGFRWYDVMSWWLRWLRGPLPSDWRGIRWNDFTGAELKLAQFREATIITTSFAKADLYRAVFDRALLCDVNFSDADLSNASFWGATIDDRTYSWLRKTAWWIAVGWNSDNFRKLLQPQSEDQADPQRPSVYPPTDPADARALRHALRTSERFHTDVEIPIMDTPPGRSIVRWRSTIWPGRWQPGESKARIWRRTPHLQFQRASKRCARGREPGDLHHRRFDKQGQPGQGLRLLALGFSRYAGLYPDAGRPDG